jgi:hypothetical protein
MSTYLSTGSSSIVPHAPLAPANSIVSFPVCGSRYTDTLLLSTKRSGDDAVPRKVRTISRVKVASTKPAVVRAPRSIERVRPNTSSSV